MSKKKKVEKETRRLIEAVSDTIKRKKDGGYKFKSGKKKVIKKIKRTCLHWVIRKGKEVPCVHQDPENPNNWKCDICGATFPIRPLNEEEYSNTIKSILESINQMQFWSVKMGGDKDDTKLFVQLKQLLMAHYVKAQKAIVKNINKRQRWDERNTKTDGLTQFDSYAGFDYRS